MARSSESSLINSGEVRSCFFPLVYTSPTLAHLAEARFGHRARWCGSSHSGTPKRRLYLHAVAMVRAIHLMVRGHGLWQLSQREVLSMCNFLPIGLPFE